MQLTAVTATDFPNAILDRATSSPGPAAAVTPHASASPLPTPDKVLAAILANKWARAALAIGLAPIWYLGFPVTLPLSIFAASILQRFANPAIDPLTTGIALFAAIPVVAIQSTFSQLFTSASKAAAAIPQVARKGHRNAAGSQRIAGHHAVASSANDGTPKVKSSGNKKPSTGNSGRGISNANRRS